MEPASQIIRLSIPGSIFVLAGVGTYAFANVLWDQSLSNVESLTTLTTSITAIAASIPLGFLIYQIYYWHYGPFVFRSYVSRDLGRDALSGLSPEILARLRTLFNARLDVRRHHELIITPGVRGLKLLRLNDELLRARYKDRAMAERLNESKLFEKDERNIRRIYTDNWYENWDVFRALLDLVGVKGGRPEIKRNFMNLYDIYHSLGASRLAAPLGAVAGVVYLGLAHEDEIGEHLLSSAAGLVVVLTAAGLIAYVLHRTRIATWRSAISKVRLDIVGCFRTNPDLVRALPPQRPVEPRLELRRPWNERLRRYKRPLPSRLARRPIMALLGEIGTIEWSRRTKGLLTWSERWRFSAAARLTIASETPRLLAARVRRKAAGPDPSEVRPPETAFGESVIEACKGLEPMVLAHCHRSYIFGRTLAKAEGIDCNEEALFAATMLHDYSLPATDALDEECFTAAGARRVTELLRASSLSEELQLHVLDAMTLHLNPVVDLKQGAIQRFTHAGIMLDMFGVRARELDPEGVERVFQRHPRHGFTVRVDSILRAHGGRVKESRSHLLFAAGLTPFLAMSRWSKYDDPL